MRRGQRRLHPVARALGSVALIVTAAVHAWLYIHAGYRHIPTIGPSFVAVVAAAALLGVLVATHGGAWLAAASGGFLLSVFGGYVLSATVGLFGFTETGQTTAALICGVAEVGGALLLGAGAFRACTARSDLAPRSSSRTAAAAK